MPNTFSISAKRAWSAQIILSLLYIMSFLDRLILVLLIDPIKSDIGVSDVEMSILIGSSFAVVYTLFGLPFARLADTSNRHALLFIGAVTWGLCTALSAFAESFLMLLILRVGVAIGEATLTPTAISFIADLFPRNKRNLPISIFVMLGVWGGCGGLMFGGAILSFVGDQVLQIPIIGPLSPWRATLLFVGIPTLILAVLSMIIIPSVERQENDQNSSSLRAIIDHVLEHRTGYIGFYAMVMLSGSISFVLLTWFPTHLIRDYGLSAGAAGLQFGLVGLIASTIGGLIVPRLSHNFIEKRIYHAPIYIAMIVTCAAIPLFVASLLADNATLSLILLLIPLCAQFGVGITLASTVVKLAPSGARAQLYALFNLVLTLVGLGIAPTIVAWVMETSPKESMGVGSSMAMLISFVAPLMIIVAFTTKRRFSDLVKSGSEGGN